ncbi:MAG: nitroreductase [Ignavibacteria bacterium]
MQNVLDDGHPQQRQRARALPLHELLARRRSPKAFLNKPLEPEILSSLFEATRWSPSSRNEQPWRFIVASKEPANDYDRLFDVLNEANKAWAHTAPVFAAVVAKMTFDRDGRPNRAALFDVGGAVAALTAQAVSLGLQVHPMGGFDSARLKAVCRIPDGYEPIVMLAIGYPDEKALLKEGRVRNQVSSFVFQGM